MEFLFLNQIASIEALILFGCILILVGIFGYDFFFYLRRIIQVLFPKRTTPLAESLISASNEVKTELTSSTDFATIDGVVLDNPVLYPESSPSDSKLPADDTVGVVEPTQSIESTTPQEVAIQSGDDIEPIEEATVAAVDIPEKVEPQPDNPIEEKDTLIESEGKGDTLEPPKQAEPPEIIDQVSHPKKATKDHSHTKTHHPSHEEEKKPKESHHIKPEKREKLVEIINNVKTLIARGHIDDAKALIVSGLAIDKENRDLNLIMANIYEREHAFTKAEFILKDIASNYPDDTEVLTHLATDLALQKKYEVSYEIYKKILTLAGETEEALYTLTHLASELGLDEDILSYARLYLKKYPNNPEILWLYAQAQINQNERKPAVETLIKLKNLTPYNQEIADLIQKLMTEEELAGNFGGEK